MRRQRQRRPQRQPCLRRCPPHRSRDSTLRPRRLSRPRRRRCRRCEKRHSLIRSAGGQHLLPRAPLPWILAALQACACLAWHRCHSRRPPRLQAASRPSLVLASPTLALPLASPPLTLPLAPPLASIWPTRSVRTTRWWRRRRRRLLSFRRSRTSRRRLPCLHYLRRCRRLVRWSRHLMRCHHWSSLRRHRPVPPQSRRPAQQRLTASHLQLMRRSHGYLLPHPVLRRLKSQSHLKTLLRMHMQSLHRRGCHCRETCRRRRRVLHRCRLPPRTNPRALKRRQKRPSKKSLGTCSFPSLPWVLLRVYQCVRKPGHQHQR
mmetsp:Transcript_36058/g.92905  ORF Transcript_36058/g.92905 Transcript_36058/m.92905 type:complete len:318 (-) Transcript_36058:264-1217(-)